MISPAYDNSVYDYQSPRTSYHNGNKKDNLMLRDEMSGFHQNTFRQPAFYRIGGATVTSGRHEPKSHFEQLNGRYHDVDGRHEIALSGLDVHQYQEQTSAYATTYQKSPSFNQLYTFPSQHEHTFDNVIDDTKASSLILSTIADISPNTKHARYLLALLSPLLLDVATPVSPRWETTSHEFLDDRALDSILVCLDSLFFFNALRGRCRWEWSSPTSTRYHHDVIGTTALRQCTYDQGGFETLIVLSAPILRQSPFHAKHKRHQLCRRTDQLLFHTFLHEIVHAYLFVKCGWAARRADGHTPAFRTIMRAIGRWISDALPKTSRHGCRTARLANSMRWDDMLGDSRADLSLVLGDDADGHHGSADRSWHDDMARCPTYAFEDRAPDIHQGRAHDVVYY